MKNLTIRRAHEGDDTIDGEWLRYGEVQRITLIVNGQHPDRINQFHAFFNQGYDYENDDYDKKWSIKLPFKLNRGDIVQLFDQTTLICSLYVRGKLIYF